MLMEDHFHGTQARANDAEDDSDCFLRVFSSQDIAEESGRLQIDDIIDIESFEDDKFYYVVVKYMPAGDLLNYVCKQPT